MIKNFYLLLTSDVAGSKLLETCDYMYIDISSSNYTQKIAARKSRCECVRVYQVEGLRMADSFYIAGSAKAYRRRLCS